MNTQELLKYQLPEQLIAKYPLDDPLDAKMLKLDKKTSQTIDNKITDITKYLNPGDCLVVNDTKVIPARLCGKKSTSGKVYCQLDKIINAHEAIVFLRANKAPKVGQQVHFEHNIYLTVLSKNHTRFKVKFNFTINEVLTTIGLPPIPPYLKRSPEKIDTIRYQTCYANEPGAVAAPTAGLHFTTNLIQELKSHGVKIAKLTLHVGAGTFEPVTDEQIKSGKLHSEQIIVSPELCHTWQQTKKSGNKVIAVGTTCVRALESAYHNNCLQPMNGETSLLIKPGYKFQAIDGMLTNFHLPGSSLLLLIAAFYGVEKTVAAYQYAINNNYRFFSYGDCMLIN